MNGLFASLPEIQRDVSAGYVQALIQMQRQELFTGLLRLSYGSDLEFYLTFLEGMPNALYRMSGEKIVIVQREGWAGALDRPDASVSRLAASVEALRVFRVFFESSKGRIETFNLSSDDLARQIGGWMASPESSVLIIRSEKLISIDLLAGYQNPMIEGVDLGTDSGQFTVRSASAPGMFPNGEYEVARYIGDGGQDVWQEYQLRLAFAPFMRMLVTRFGELAGRIMAERLCGQLSTWCEDGGWRISVNPNRLVNSQLFDSADQASQVYAGILRCFNEEASLALGPRLTDNLSREMLAKMDGHSRELLAKRVHALIGVSLDV